MAEPLCRLPLGEPTLKQTWSPKLASHDSRPALLLYTNYDDERFQALVQLPLPPMINHVGCVCRAVRASRCGSVPSNLVLPGGLAWVAEMAWRIWCCKAAIATIHQLSCVMACLCSAVCTSTHATCNATIARQPIDYSKFPTTNIQYPLYLVRPVYR